MSHGENKGFLHNYESTSKYECHEPNSPSFGMHVLSAFVPTLMLTTPCIAFSPSLLSPQLPLPRMLTTDCLHAIGHQRRHFHTSMANSPSISPSTDVSKLGDLPGWVGMLNQALETSALATLLAYLLIDVFATFTVLGALAVLRVPVAADFAVALALSKAVRGPRLALDVSVAASLARRMPSLKAVKVTKCLDEFATSLAVLRRSFEQGFEQERHAPAASGQAVTPHPATTAPLHADRLAAAARAARQLTSDYGLAYMAAKNAIALLSMLLILLCLRSGGPAKAATAALLRMLRVNAKAGLFAGQLAFAVTLHYALFPLIVLGAARLGPRIAAQSSATTLVSVSAHED